MTGCRHLLRHRWIAALAIVVAALLTRMLLPTGYMPMAVDGHVAIILCAEQNPGLMDMTAMPDRAGMKAMAGAKGRSGDPHMPEHDKNGSCGFGGLSLASLATIDPIVLALAILFIVARLFRRPHIAHVAARRFLWPPRTGPPSAA